MAYDSCKADSKKSVIIRLDKPSRWPKRLYPFLEIIGSLDLVSSHSMCILPSELCIQIVEEIAAPPHDYAYSLSTEACSSLAQIALVDSAFYRIAMPALYRRVHVTSRNIAQFYRSLERRIGEDVPSQVPKVVAFACTGIEPDEIVELAEVIGNIIFALSHSLERLLLDIALRELYSYESLLPIATLLQSKLDRVSGLVELISTRDELYLAGWTSGPVCWTEWPNIKRLALYNLEIDTAFIDALQRKRCLETLCVLNPRIDWVTRPGHPVPELLRRSPITLQSLLLIDLEDWDEEDYMPFTNIQSAREFLGDTRLKMVQALPETRGTTPLDWYLSVALSGKLWELDKCAIGKDDPIVEPYEDVDT